MKCEGDECNILNIGDVVRYKLNYPIDFKGNRLIGNFRMGDVKWSLKPTKITKVILLPDFSCETVSALEDVLGFLADVDAWLLIEILFLETFILVSFSVYSNSVRLNSSK